MGSSPLHWTTSRQTDRRGACFRDHTIKDKDELHTQKQVDKQTDAKDESSKGPAQGWAPASASATHSLCGLEVGDVGAQDGFNGGVLVEDGQI